MRGKGGDLALVDTFETVGEKSKETARGRRENADQKLVSYLVPHIQECKLTIHCLRGRVVPQRGLCGSKIRSSLVKSAAVGYVSSCAAKLLVRSTGLQPFARITL